MLTELLGMDPRTFAASCVALLTFIAFVWVWGRNQ